MTAQQQLSGALEGFRFTSADRFASFTGTAPVAASSGEVVCYRLKLGGQREMNKVLHIAARVQTHMPNSAGRVNIHGELAEGKTRTEAIRSLKRHLANPVYRALQPASRHESVRGGQPGRVGQAEADKDAGLGFSKSLPRTSSP